MSTQNDSQDANPYRPPAYVDESTPTGSPHAVDRDTVMKFRQQIHALGAFWIIIGFAAIALATVASSLLREGPRVIDMSPDRTIIIAVILSTGIAWIVVGVLSCLKQLWAVYVGLVLSYVSLTGNLLNLNFCGLIIVIVVILQAHRVIAWAKRMQRYGAPLTLKPEQFRG